MIVDPPDGRIPYSAAGRARREARPGQTSEGPEGRSPQERCISYGIPRLGGPYSQNVHIAQTPDHVLLLHEMVHEFRVIPLDGRPHVPGHVRQWLGDSRGRWEGDTLVVETTNFRDAQWFQGLSQGGMRLVERFTRVDAGTVRYAVTFEDPDLWDAAVDGGDPDAADRGGDVRVRLPRGEHGHDGPARDRPGRGGRGERFAVAVRESARADESQGARRVGAAEGDDSAAAQLDAAVDGGQLDLGSPCPSWPEAERGPKRPWTLTGKSLSMRPLTVLSLRSASTPSGRVRRMLPLTVRNERSSPGTAPSVARTSPLTVLADTTPVLSAVTSPFTVVAVTSPDSPVTRTSSLVVRASRCTPSGMDTVNATFTSLFRLLMR